MASTTPVMACQRILVGCPADQSQKPETSMPAGRLALADLLLAVITAGMLASGFWDWFAEHPTKIRWHAITGVVLAILLAVHTIRRRSRLRRSAVR